MKLSEQIVLLTTTLDEYGYKIEADESAGEVAADVIRELELAYGKDRVVQMQARIAELESELEDARDALDALDSIISLDELREPDPIADAPTGPVIPCDDCTYMNNDRPIKRLCRNVEAIRRKFARRGYSTPVGHGCGMGRQK